MEFPLDISSHPNKTRTVLGPTQPPTKWVPESILWEEVAGEWRVHWPPSSSEVMNKWSCTPTHPSVSVPSTLVCTVLLISDREKKNECKKHPAPTKFMEIYESKCCYEINRLVMNCLNIVQTCLVLMKVVFGSRQHNNLYVWHRIPIDCRAHLISRSYRNKPAEDRKWSLIYIVPSKTSWNSLV